MIMMQKLYPGRYAMSDIRVDRVIVVAKGETWVAKPGDVGIVVPSGKYPHVRYTIKFANGNTGMQYPDFEHMVSSGFLQGDYSFFHIEIKP
jgi:hypothetical protein